ncbi:MAG: helix-turn-helix transcriptional regulator [Acidobacteriota bacterium]
MEHLKIAYYLAVLLVGAAAVAYAVLMSRTWRLPFLAPFAWFLGFNNVLALVNLTSAYACANLLGFCAAYGYTVLAGTLGPVARLSQAGIVYALCAVIRGFDGRRLSRAFNISFGLAAGLLLASYAVRAFLARGAALLAWLDRGQLAVFALGVLAMLGALAALFIRSRKTKDAAERKAVRAFAAAYFAVYAVFVATFWLPTDVQFPPNALALLAINVIPFVWFGRLFARAYAVPAASAGDREALDRFCRARGLTAREADILGLILRGKSNAEMERELFISIHTVKNHITSIHAKLGVRSRWQLISLFHSGPGQRTRADGEMRPQNGLGPQ